VRSTTFVFKALCTSIKKFGFFRVQTRAHRHVVGQSAAAPPKATHRPRPRLPHAPAPRGTLESSRATCAIARAVPARCAPRTAGPSAAPRRTRTGRGYRTTVASPPSPRYHRRGVQLINIARFPSSRRHRRPTAPSVPPPSSCAPIAFHGRATILAPSLGSIGPTRVACCSGRAYPVARAEPPWRPLPALTVHPRRRLLRPNFGHP
jgi:hypothetical protein